MRLVRLCLKLLVTVLPLAMLVAHINYTVDGGAVLRGDKYELEIANAWLEGKAVGHFDNTVNERSVMRLYVENLPEAPDTLVLGSSRGMQITQAIAGTAGRFFNAGMTGADRKDILNTFYLFDKAGKLPQDLIIAADPWLLYDADAALNWRSDDALYREFLTRCLGYQMEYEQPDDSPRRQALWSLAYFQENMRYRFTDHSAESRPEILPDAPLDYDFDIRTSDGTQWYARELRQSTQDEVDLQALTLSGVDYAQLYGFTQVSQPLAQQFEAFLRYAVSRGVRVTLVLAPFHPIYWQKLLTDPDYAGVQQAEQALRVMADGCGAWVYGSYDPAQAYCTNADFYDGLHVRRESMGNFFPGVGRPLTPPEEEELQPEPQPGQESQPG